jgi:PEP-CTERM motif
MVTGLMKKLALLIAVLLAATCSYASLSDGEDFTNPETLTLLSINGAWQNGYPYTATMTGVQGPLAVMCDDYAHGGAVGESWTANIMNLGTEGIGLARFNLMPDALTLYKEAGWILLQTPITPPNEYADMNFAVWHIFDSAAPLDSGALAWLEAAQLEAQHGFQGVPFDRVFIITPVDQYDPNPAGIQEFLTIDSKLQSTTPEPGTLLLLGTGLLGLWKLKVLR